MNCICKKHDPPFRWVVSDTLSGMAKEGAKVCACGENGEIDTEPPKLQEPAPPEKTGIDIACSLLERWYGSPTEDPTLQRDTYDFLVGPGE